MSTSSRRNQATKAPAAGPAPRRSKRRLARPPATRIGWAALIAALLALGAPGAAQGATEGVSNNFFGTNAGLSNTTGFANSFFGGEAGRNNTTGFFNSFFGRSAGLNNTTGASNSFFGRSAGVFNTTGAENSFFGREAGFNNSTGALNSFFGREAGVSNTSGNNNSFFGRRAGRNNTTGNNNSFVGNEAGRRNTTGARNVFIGRNAGLSNTTANDNTLIGVNADGAAGITRASAIGARAKVSQSDSLVLGAIAGLNNATADTKVGIGSPAPAAPLHVRSTAATGAGNELLRLDQANTGATQDRALMRLRNKGGTRVQFDNTATSNSWRYQFGNAGQDNFEVTKVGSGALEMRLGPSGDLAIAGTLSQGSDRASKHRVEPVAGSQLLELLKDLEITEWTYRDDPSGARHLGPMAQDFHAAFGLGSDRKKLAPGDLAGVGLAAIKELQRENEELRQRVDKQNKRLKALED